MSKSQLSNKYKRRRSRKSYTNKYFYNNSFGSRKESIYRNSKSLIS